MFPDLNTGILKLRPNWNENDPKRFKKDDVKNENQLSKNQISNNRILNDQILSKFENIHPCKNQFNWPFGVSKCCMSICICLVEALSRKKNFDKINWEREVFYMAYQINQAWLNRTDYKSEKKFPLIEELFEIVKQSQLDKFILGECNNGILTSENNPKLNSEVAVDIETVIKTNLVKSLDFLIITVRENSFLLGKLDEKFFFFDSHGHLKFEPSDKTVIVFCATAEQLMNVVTTCYYKDMKQEKEKSIKIGLINTFNAYFIKIK